MKIMKKLFFTLMFIYILFISCDKPTPTSENNNNNNNSDSCAVITPAISPPESFFAKAVSLSQVQLTWSQVSNATNYTIFKNNGQLTTTPNLYYNDNFTLIPQQQYEYYVVASNSNNTSVPSRKCATSYAFGNLNSGHTLDIWNISLPQDRDMYMIINVDPSLDIRWFSGGGNGIRIFDTDGVTEIFNAQGPSGGNQTSINIGAFWVKAGNYTIRIGRYGGSGNYNFTCYYSQTQFNNDQEPNDGISNAISMNFNTRYQGHLGYKGGGSGTTDVLDYYQILLNNNQSNIKLTVNVDPSLDLRWYSGGGNGIVFYKDDGVTIETSFQGPLGSSQPSFSTTLSLNAGHYYIRIGRYGGYGGYDIKLCY